MTDQDLEAATWPELLRVPRRALAVGDLIADLRVDYLPRAGADLLRLKATLTVLGRRHLTSVLIVGGRTRTEDANRALEGLAGLVRDDPPLSAAFTELGPAELLAQLDIDESFRAFREELHRFRTEYGHRETTTPLLAGVPLIATSSLRPPTDAGAHVLVSGVAASGCRAGGPVRIVSGPEDFRTRVAAVVVNSGGIASHAAIVAREYGVPAVMGTGHATSVLRPGQRVTVDGDTGQVTAGAA